MISHILFVNRSLIYNRPRMNYELQYNYGLLFIYVYISYIYTEPKLCDHSSYRQQLKVPNRC